MVLGKAGSTMAFKRREIIIKYDFVLNHLEFLKIIIIILENIEKIFSGN